MQWNRNELYFYKYDLFWFVPLFFIFFFSFFLSRFYTFTPLHPTIVIEQKLSSSGSHCGHKVGNIPQQVSFTDGKCIWENKFPTSNRTQYTLKWKKLIAGSNEKGRCGRDIHFTVTNRFWCEKIRLKLTSFWEYYKWSCGEKFSWWYAPQVGSWVVSWHRLLVDKFDILQPI